MVNLSFFEKIMGLIFALIAVLIMQGCSSNYQVGDISKRYCTTTNQEARVMLKAVLNANGVNIGVDYCTAYTIIEVVK